MRIALLALALLTSAAHAETPAKRARSILDAQVAALVDTTKPLFETLFDPKGIILGVTHGETLEDANVELYQTIAGGSPHSYIKKAKVSSFSGGGTDDAVWFTAELAITIRSQEPESGPPKTMSHTMRITELVVADGSEWKVVASTIDRPQSPTASAEARTSMKVNTPAGPLAALPAAVPALKAAFANDPAVVVIGTDKGERAIGPKAVGKLLDRWSKLKLEMDSTVREVRTKTYGFVQSNVDMVKGKDRYRMMVLLIALPKADGTWAVQAVHYSSY